MRKPKTIAPRLLSKDSRIGIGHLLPDGIKEGLKSIARKENQSVSWVLEQVIIDYFDLPRPKYVKRKK
jgi:hypothetical protein